MSADTSAAKSKATAATTSVRALKQLYHLLTASERRKLAMLFASMILVAIVETAGIGSIAPFMALIANPQVIETNEILNRIYTGLGFTSTYNFLLFAGASVLAFVILSNVISAVMMWLELRYLWNVHHRISRELLDRYLWLPYSRFITHNTADLSTNILSETVSITSGLLVPLAKGLSRAAVAVCIMILLIAIDYRIALLSVLLLGGMYVAIYGTFRRRFSSIGDKRLESNTRRFRLAGEALQGFKDVKILGREPEFLARFSNASADFSRHSADSQIIGALPRYAVDIVAFGGMVTLILYMMALKADFRQVLPVVSLYALAGYRLMPALQQVFDGASRLRFYGAPLERLYRDLTATFPRDAEAPPRGAAPAVAPSGRIKLESVEFSYPDTEQPAIRGVSLEISRNQTVAFVGSTGCGKTTLVDIIMGLLRPQRGSVMVDGAPLTSSNARAWQRRLGYVPQHIYLSDETIGQNIAFGLPAHEIDRDALERAAQIANLSDFVATLPLGYDTVVGDRGVRLSGGQRQRIGIARALYHNPEVLIFDEATSALDSVTEDAVMEAIRKLSNQKTIILIAHRLTTVRDAHTIFFMRQGQVVQAGSHAELIQLNPEFRAMAQASA